MLHDVLLMQHLESVGDSFLKDRTLDGGQVVRNIGRFLPLRDSNVNIKQICSEINSLTKFWLKLRTCVTVYTRTSFPTHTKYDGL